MYVVYLTYNIYIKIIDQRVSLCYCKGKLFTKTKKAKNTFTIKSAPTESR
ncbi:hypothetical protein RAAC3_TM7C00001G0494 [Candidatus Saccharibacteria bacterium RAAC3_TM7_1]|nr:hypothetical protein RAAC3_TM7C00001G0494 [Candidatus Saccharibacteria bacterium RAAC3_TM7_1]